MARRRFAPGKITTALGWSGIVVQAYLINLRVVDVGRAVGWVAVCCEALGIAAISAGFLYLGEGNQIGLTRPPIRLQTGGIHRITRNPIYPGFHLLTLAAILYTLNPAILALGAVSIGVHHAIIRAEEAHLETELGPPYRDYTRAARRYV